MGDHGRAQAPRDRPLQDGLRLGAAGQLFAASRLHRLRSSRGRTFALARPNVRRLLRALVHRAHGWRCRGAFPDCRTRSVKSPVFLVAQPTKEIAVPNMNPWKTGVTLAATLAIAYTACAVVFALAPERGIDFVNA